MTTSLLAAIITGTTEVEIPVAFWPKCDLGSDFRESHFKTLSGAHASNPCTNPYM